VTLVRQSNITNPCVRGNPTIGGEPTTDYSNPNCICLEKTATFTVLCDKYLKNSKDYNSCVTCQGIWTGLGCIKSDLEKFITENVMTFGMSLAGIIAVLCIIYSAFELQTSSANPEKIKNAQERLTSCILGLLLIIFSIFILKLIGVDILRIPGFGTPS